MFCASLAFGQSFSLATLNLQNLFDLTYDSNEYSDYKPFGVSHWNDQNFAIKIKNLARLIDDVDADILALQEIENDQVLQVLNAALPKPYAFRYVAENPSSITTVGVLSRLPIAKTLQIPPLDIRKKPYRPILKVQLQMHDASLWIYINHWPSRKNPESHRIAYALTLLDELLRQDDPFVVIGDLNSNYNETSKIKRLKLNNVFGTTAIAHILPTMYSQCIALECAYHFYTPSTLSAKALYNPWLEIDKQDRYSYFYRKRPNTLSHILISKQLFDGKGFEYTVGSFQVVKPPYLLKSYGDIQRWKKVFGGYYKGKKVFLHQGKGYTDHLPLKAHFTFQNHYGKP